MIYVLAESSSFLYYLEKGHMNVHVLKGIDSVLACALHSYGSVRNVFVFCEHIFSRFIVR